MSATTTHDNTVRNHFLYDNTIVRNHYDNTIQIEASKYDSHLHSHYLEQQKQHCDY